METSVSFKIIKENWILFLKMETLLPFVELI